MALIPAEQARSIFTQTLIDVYRERPRVMSFLRSFFPSVESVSKFVSIEVERGTELVAVDVVRGSEGNRNEVGLSTVKTLLPPYFREYFDATELDLYDRIIGTSGDIDSTVFAQFIDSVADKMVLLVDKIERAYELQCAQVLETGIVTLNNGSNVDYKRKALSKVDKGGGQYWDTANPYTDLETAAQFIREQGKSQGAVVNAIFGGQAWTSFLTNAKVLERNDIKSFTLDAINAPQRNSIGASFHGEVTIGSYRARLWTYPEVYQNRSNGAMVPYVNPKNVIVLPENPRFKMAFAAVPQLLTAENKVFKKGAYVFGDFPDERKATHEYDVKSAGIAVPVAVDQIHTTKVVAG